MIAFDTNILIYAELPIADDMRHRQSAKLLAKAALLNAIMPLQVLGEFLHVCRRKAVVDHDTTSLRLETYTTIFETPETRLADLAAAQMLVHSHNFQFFDAVIVSVALRSGATMLLSEDMLDGLEVEGLRIVNPFAAANDALLADYFDSVL